MALDRARLGWHVAWKMPVVIHVTVKVLLAVWVLLAVAGVRAEPSQEREYGAVCVSVRSVTGLTGGGALTQTRSRSGTSTFQSVIY